MKDKKYIQQSDHRKCPNLQKGIRAIKVQGAFKRLIRQSQKTSSPCRFTVKILKNTGQGKVHQKL